MEKRPKKKRILLLDMYGVIIKESKGYFIPYTFEHFDKKEHNRLTRAFREECLFTKAGNGELSSDEFLSLLGYPDPAETIIRFIFKNTMFISAYFKEELFFILPLYLFVVVFVLFAGMFSSEDFVFFLVWYHVELLFHKFFPSYQLYPDNRH